MDSELQGAAVNEALHIPTIDLSFACNWQAEVLAVRPLILPPRHFVYPRKAEEVERGALEVMVRPSGAGTRPFLATCALGFRDAAAPTGIWSAPNPEEMCAAAGGYVYLIDTTAPERFTMIEFRPVMKILPAVEAGLLLFVGHRSILAWGREGQAWESETLSDEGVTILGVQGGVLRGTGWEMRTDKETTFALELRGGTRMVNAAR